MGKPILFISHFAVRSGRLDELRQAEQRTVAILREAKPRTAAFLAYLGEGSAEVSFVHLFADAEAMDAHFEGAAERSQAVAELLAPRGSEVYGAPSQPALELLRRQAESAEVPLKIEPNFEDGFLRLADAGA